MRLLLNFKQRGGKAHDLGAAEFVVITQAYSPLGALLPTPSETLYDHEDLFLRRVISADLCDETTRELVIAVILAVAKPEMVRASVGLSLSRGQMDALGLIVPATPPVRQPVPTLASPAPGFNPCSSEFYDFLMNSPTPFVMVAGPEFVFTFVNPPYMRILGRSRSDQLLGRSVLEAVPELEGQVCVTVLERAYKTGLPQTRKGLVCQFWRDETARFEEVFFDIVYHPVRDASGAVTGVMAQATDVTERTLAVQVTEQREDQLYRYWAELETIYRVLPLGIAVVEATTLRILRINERQARLLGGTPDDLVGRNILDLEDVIPDLHRLLREASATPSLPSRSLVVRVASTYSTKPLSVSVRSSLDGRGVPETLTIISQEVSDEESATDCLKGFATPFAG